MVMQQATHRIHQSPEDRLIEIQSLGLVLLKIVCMNVVCTQPRAARDWLLKLHDQPQQSALPAACQENTQTEFSSIE